MERVLIIGNCGAGKSTFARALAEKTGLPLVHLDKLYWHGDWEHLRREEFDPVLQTELEKPQWIIDGNFNRTIPQRLAKCDTVIYLDYNRLVCLWGVICRIVKSYGKTRPDMGEGCPERIDFEFMKWVWNFNRDKRDQNYGYLNEAAHAETYAFKNRRQLKRFLKSL